MCFEFRGQYESRRQLRKQVEKNCTKHLPSKNYEALKINQRLHNHLSDIFPNWDHWDKYPILKNVIRVEFLVPYRFFTCFLN